MTNADNQITLNAGRIVNEIRSSKIINVQLNKIPLLAEVDEITLKKIAISLKVYGVDPGRSILGKGDTGEHLILVLSGRFQVTDLAGKGHVPSISFMSAGDYYGELSIIDGLLHSATVVACEQSVYALLPRVDALNLMHNNPLVSERIFKKLALGVRQASNFRVILGISNAFQRVYALLHYLSKTSPGGLVVVESLPTQQEISIMINTSRETVSRAMQVLIQRGVVEKDLRRLIIRKPENLRDEASASRLLQAQLNQ